MPTETGNRHPLSRGICRSLKYFPRESGHATAATVITHEQSPSNGTNDTSIDVGTAMLVPIATRFHLAISRKLSMASSIFPAVQAVHVAASITRSNKANTQPKHETEHFQRQILNKNVVHNQNPIAHLMRVDLGPFVERSHFGGSCEPLISLHPAYTSGSCCSTGLIPRLNLNAFSCKMTSVARKRLNTERKELQKDRPFG